MWSILINHRQRKPIFMTNSVPSFKLLYLNTKVLERHIGAAEELFIDYDENHAAPLPDQLKVTFLKQTVITDERLKTVYEECYDLK